MTTSVKAILHNRGMKNEAPPKELAKLLETLADRLRYAMDFRKTNPNQIEVATGIKRQTLYAVLKGETENFTWVKLIALSEHLGVRTEWLARGEWPMYPMPTLEESEVQLVHDFRQLSPGHQRDLADIAHRWAEEDDEEPIKGSRLGQRRPIRQ
jgi:transcriptional regulator with XRE-family HTH domain